MCDNLPYEIDPSRTIPLSRFDNETAREIFTQVNNAGFKVVTENNHPICVLLSTEYYEELIELIGDYELMQRADEIMRNMKDTDWISHEDILKNFGIDESEVDDGEDIDID